MIKIWSLIKNNFTTIKNISAIGVADVVGSAVSSIFWLYLALIVIAEKYGEIHYYIAIAGIGSTVSLLGSESMLRVYISKGVKLQSTVYFIVLVTTALTSIVLFLIYYKVEIIILTLGFVISNLAISESFGKKMFTFYSKLFILQKILGAALPIVLYYLFDVNGVLVGLALSYIPYIFQIYQGFKESQISFTLLKDRFTFFLTSFAYTFSGLARGQIDKLIIAPMLGFGLLGNYSFALQIIAIFMILPNVIYKYTLPHDASGKSSFVIKKITVLISIGVTILGVILSPIVIPVFFPKYIEAIPAIQILSFHPIPATIGLMINSKFLGSEKNRVILIGTAISFTVHIGGVVILGPIIGIIGAALSFVLSSTANCLYLLTMNTKMRSDFTSKPTTD
ncbi:lipopolysaccharide biosynthesis protein [Candidatus Nitrosotenuis sp. DW1]|uniref:lipopolysaccharide biosynthesis protein n=1 Tax=Candidatus Nitrosotenuis sp. DW1 TaxID=2259672 RepID=UPI0015CD8F09|nr:polysaccharide biosynthesis C-terminal domain-containing protein [Candidatus Nitrosotenuis sp. DW1]QLH09713.1 hypothetical protein DSQ19_09770 [Candidatus Nitrosotenuis sp. DW1]